MLTAEPARQALHVFPERRRGVVRARVCFRPADSLPGLMQNTCRLAGGARPRRRTATPAPAGTVPAATRASVSRSPASRNVRGCADAQHARQPGQRRPSRSCSMSASAANLRDSSVISGADRLSESRRRPGRARQAPHCRRRAARQSAAPPPRTPAARLASSSRAAISVSRPASSAAASLTPSSVPAVSHSSGSPGGLADRWSSSPASAPASEGRVSPAASATAALTCDHAAQRVQRGCRLVQARVQ